MILKTISSNQNTIKGIKHFSETELISYLKNQKILVFDIGGTLAEKNTPTKNMVDILAQLLNNGSLIAIASAKAIDAVSPWITEDGGLAAKLLPFAKENFFIYSDRMTKVFSLNQSNKIIEISKIPFPSFINKELIASTLTYEIHHINNELIDSNKISLDTKNIIVKNPICVHIGDEYVQITSDKNIDIKNDPTSKVARELLLDIIKRTLSLNGLLINQIGVVLDGKKGVYIKNSRANKPGAIVSLSRDKEIAIRDMVYFGDQFIGESAPDRAVCQVGINSINISTDIETSNPAIYNLNGGPEKLELILNEIIWF